MSAAVVPMSRRTALALTDPRAEGWLLDPPGEEPALWTGTQSEIIAAVEDALGEPWPPSWTKHLRRVRVDPVGSAGGADFEAQR